MTDKYDDREITLNNGERMTVREFLAIRKEEGLKIDPSTAEVTWWYARVSTLMVSTPTFQRVALVGNTLLADLAGTFGSSLATCQRRRVTRYGNGINPNWYFLLGSKTLPSRTDDANEIATNAHGAGGRASPRYACAAIRTLPPFGSGEAEAEA